MWLALDSLYKKVFDSYVRIQPLFMKSKLLSYLWFFAFVFSGPLVSYTCFASFLWVSQPACILTSPSHRLLPSSGRPSLWPPLPAFSISSSTLLSFGFHLVIPNPLVGVLVGPLIAVNPRFPMITIQASGYLAVDPWGSGLGHLGCIC